MIDTVATFGERQANGIKSNLSNVFLKAILEPAYIAMAH
jgi:hypothetical protein